MSKELFQEFRRRYKSAKVDADLWASLLEACYYNAVPFRNRFYKPKEQQGEQKNTRLYDTTLPEATKTFVSKIQDAMTPPQTQWGFLEVDADWLVEEFDQDDISEAQADVDTYMRKLFKFIHASNFDVAVNESFFDLSISTGCLVVNQFTDDNPLLFTSIPADKLAIAEALNGKVETWFRTWDDIKISELQTRWKKALPTQQMIQSLRDNPDSKIKKVYEGVAYFPDAKKKYIYSVWTDESPLFFEELESNPAIVWRFQKTNNEVWGRGPVMDALPSAISLQEMARIELASANLNTFRPYMASSDGVFNPHTFQLKPFTVIPIAPVGAGGVFPLTPLPDSSNPQFAQLTIADLRVQIKTIMYSDDHSDQDGIQPQTATELLMKQQNLAKKIGPLFSRLQHEFLEPLIERCSYILDKSGHLPKPRIDGKLVKFKYRSPLALAKGVDDVEKLGNFIRFLQGSVGEEATRLLINQQEMPWLVAESLQIDPRFLFTKDEAKANAEQMAKMQALMAQQEQAQEQPQQGPQDV
ncbi:MAG: portal protein [Colwellia sp.]|nr:portal protein [Colwellia sp.]